MSEKETAENCAHSKPVPPDCALGTWQPIETWDKLKKKPEFAVFYVQPKEGNRPYTGLPRMIVTERRYGSRVVSHWMPLPAPPV